VERRIMSAKPFVSIVIPCRNETRFIRACLGSIVSNDYPADSLEVLVVDGMSTDDTRGIVAELARAHACIKLLDNPKHVTPSALNIGIREARGEIIIRMDAHSEYPAHYISKCVEQLTLTRADVVGGPINSRPIRDTLMANTIALATSHPFGGGNSKFRTSSQAAYVDTVPFGAYRREVFERVGFFDERLVRNQDNEFSSRIIQSGGKIYLTPELTAFYHNQDTFAGFVRQAFRTGMWNVWTVSLTPEAFQLRHFIPFFFVSALVVLGILSLISPAARIALAGLLAAYFGL